MTCEPLATLARYGALTAEASAGYLPASEPSAHLYDLVGDYPSRAGKAIRPSLCLAACRAFGGALEEALPSAVAIELLHNAFLIHDDIEDGSLLRRGRPTLHAAHGVALAINAGDALAYLAHAPLRDNRKLLGNRMAAGIVEEFDIMIRRTLEGQATELGWRRDGVLDVGPADYLDLVLRKTCWYTTIHPLRIGATIGSWGRADLDAMVRFGFHLGAAFQIADDLLNLEADEALYGKEACGDLYEGKRTLMLVHLLSSAAPDDRRAVVDFLARERHDRTPADVASILALMIEYDSLIYARQFGEGIASVALDLFDEAFAGAIDGEDLWFLRALVPWMLDRPT